MILTSVIRRLVTASGTLFAFGLLLLSASLGQDTQKQVGIIDFYGYAGLDLDRIRAALPIREGDIYAAPVETTDKIQKALSQVLGRPPTEISSTCCDRKGDYIIFIGLPGDSIRPTKLNPVPKGKVRLPAKLVALYEETIAALSAAVLKGNVTEETSRGYAVSTSDGSLRAKQLSVRINAIRYEGLIRRVLESSGETQQRVVAAYMLGYARQSSKQIAALVRASHDSDGTVRNNATRALSVLAESNPKVAAKIPPDGFIEMLSSGSWSDRNKASWVLSTLTRSRDSHLLGRLQSQALVSLIEMARWRSSGHAANARILLGRIAGIEEKRLMQLAYDNNADEIINAVQKRNLLRP
jgi:hypothetical protein